MSLRLQFEVAKDSTGRLVADGATFVRVAEGAAADARRIVAEIQLYGDPDTCLQLAQRLLRAVERSGD